MYARMGRIKNITICLKRNDIANRRLADLNLFIETRYNAPIKNKVTSEVLSSKPPL